MGSRWRQQEGDPGGQGRQEVFTLMHAPSCMSEKGASRLWPPPILIGPAISIRHRCTVPGRYSADRYSTDHNSKPCCLRKEVTVLLRSALGISCRQGLALTAAGSNTSSSQSVTVKYSCRSHFAQWQKSSLLSLRQ